MLLPTATAESDDEPSIRHVDLRNPLKGKPKTTLQQLPAAVIHKVERRICDFVTYDAENVESLQNFDVVKQNTKCLFAKRSKVWGSPEWKPELSLGKLKWMSCKQLHLLCPPDPRNLLGKSLLNGFQVSFEVH